jgi:hypothetical protein
VLLRERDNVSIGRLHGASALLVDEALVPVDPELQWIARVAFESVIKDFKIADEHVT